MTNQEPTAAVNTPEDEEEMGKATKNLAAIKEISLDAAVLSELGSIFEEQITVGFTMRLTLAPPC